MKLPAALHPANHYVVQTLLLQAALSSDCQCNNWAQRQIYENARRIARATTAYRSGVRRNKSSPSLAPYVKATLKLYDDLLGRVHEESCTHRGIAKEDSWTSIDPLRMLALYGPIGKALTIPRVLHDTVLYEETQDHLHLLRQILGPYGFQVSTCGITRRGAPAAAHAEFILSLTREATQQVEQYEKEMKDSSNGSTRSPPNDTWSQSDAPDLAHHIAESLSFCPTTSTVTQVKTAVCAASPHPPDPQAHHSFTTVPCDDGDLFATKDTMTDPILHLHTRALQDLHRCGYCISKMLLSRASMTKREPLAIIVRYDARNPTAVPPRRCTDPVVLRRLKLHCLKLHICPWFAHAARCFLLTGPAAFTTEAMLQSTKRGVDISANGLFRRCFPPCSHSTKEANACSCTHHRHSSRSCEWERILVHGEPELFQLLNIAYVDPLLRAVVPLSTNVEAVVSETTGQHLPLTLEKKSIDEKCN